MKKQRVRRAPEQAGFFYAPENEHCVCGCSRVTHPRNGACLRCPECQEFRFSPLSTLYSDMVKAKNEQ